MPWPWRKSVPAPPQPIAPYAGRMWPHPGYLLLPMLFVLVVGGAGAAYLASAWWQDAQPLEGPPGQPPVKIRSHAEQFKELDFDNHNMVRQTFVPELDQIVQASGLCTKRCSPAWGISAHSQKSWELTTPTAVVRIIAKDWVGFDNLQPAFLLQIDQYTQRSDGDPRDDPAITWLLTTIVKRLNFGDPQNVFQCPTRRDNVRGFHSCTQEAFDLARYSYLKQHRPEYARFRARRDIQFLRRGPFTLEEASWRSDR